MEHGKLVNLPERLAQGRHALVCAPETYGRPFSAEEYWWLGVGLAAWTLADVGEKPTAANRLERLMDSLGASGISPQWLQHMVQEMAFLNAEGLLWPCYHRPEAGGEMEPTGVTVHPGFGPQEGYFLALGHLGVALAVHQGASAWLPRLTSTIGEMVETGLTKEHEAVILSFFKEEANAEMQQP